MFNIKRSRQPLASKSRSTNFERLEARELLTVTPIFQAQPTLAAIGDSYIADFVTDLDNDGWRDVVSNIEDFSTAPSASQIVRWHRNEGGRFSAPVTIVENVWVQEPVDLDRDGDLDFIGQISSGR